MRALFFIIILLFTPSVHAQEQITIKHTTIEDMKAVFATVESVNVVSARVRIRGTIADLVVDEGDLVTEGQVIAKVGDEKLVLQISSMNSRINALTAQFDKAATDLDRTKELLSTGAVSTARLDDIQTQYNIAESALKAGITDRDVIKRQVTEGDVLAPVSGRVLIVPLTAGTVVMPGEVIARIAEQNYVLRLLVPERHARFMNNGDIIRLENGKTGEIITVYPQITDGRVKADATVAELGSYFVGERVRVWISGGERQVIIVPASYIVTRFGIDHVSIRKADGKVIEIAVQRGLPISQSDFSDGIEILSGLHNGDIVVKP